MPKKVKDTDFLTISARVHAMETKLLSAERMERMIEARDLNEAAKVLVECGYGEMRQVTGDEVERILAEQQQTMMKELGSACPNRNIVDVFKLRYDYHNAKVLVKAEALNVQQDALLQGGGRYEPRELAEKYRREELGSCSDTYRNAIRQARDVLSASGDPQQADFVLDRAYFAELTEAAARSGSKFIRDYVALSIDIANLRAVVRASRLDKSPEFLNQVLVPGGTVSAHTLSTVRGEDLSGLFGGYLAEAAAEGASKANAGSGSLTEFERLCDNALMDFFGAARRTPFGIEPVVGYLFAREAESTAIRTILSGRMAGLEGNTIRQRLRRTYC